MDVPRMVKELHEGIHDTKLRIFRNNAPSITREAKRKIVFSDRKRLLFFWFVLALVGFAPWFFAGEGYICEVGEVDERTLNFDFLLIAFMPLILHIIYIAIDLVKIDKEFFRPTEVNYLYGDSRKAKKILKWEPKTDFNTLVQIMCNAELDKYR